MSKIAKLCQVDVVAVLKWIQSAAFQIELLTGASSSNVVITREMWHYSVNRKKYGFGAPWMGLRVNLWDGSVVIVRKSTLTKLLEAEHKNLYFLNR